MTCMDVRRALRTADRFELRAEGDGELARHLRGCGDCRAVAMRLETGTNVLAEMVAARGAVPGLARPRRSVASRRRRAAAVVFIPIATAAAVVALVRRDAPANVPRVFHDDAVATSVAVDVPRGQTATVLKTSNPNVTIVWLTPGGTE